MARPNTSERIPVRHNSRSISPSTSSVATVRPANSSRASSRAGIASSGSMGSSNESYAEDVKASSGPRSRFSGSGSKLAAGLSDENYSHYSKWSQSTVSSQGTVDHKRQSSFSQRFSFGTGATTAARPTSPSRKRRPADINTDNLVPRPLVAGPPRSSPSQLSPQAAYLAPKSSDSSSDAGPRTPLLDMGQISSANDYSRYSPLRAQLSAQNLSSQQSADVQHAQQWDSSALRPLQIRPKNYTQPRNPTHSNGNTAVANNTHVRSTSPTKSKSRKDKDKKSMLSRALQRANDAVQLDNAQNHMGAIEAYEEACEYLTLVMAKTSKEDDKLKLSTIRTTYQSRIYELQQLDSQGHPQPQVQPLDSSGSADLSFEDEKASTTQEAKVATGSTTTVLPQQEALVDFERPGNSPRNLSLGNFEPGPTISMPDFNTLVAEGAPATTTTADTLAPPSDSDVPPPLSPRRPPPPVPTEATESFSSLESGDDYDSRRESNLIGNSADVYSTWLENQRDSRRFSKGSSNHSMSSANGLRRKHFRTHSSNTEAEFDAALDAAVEAAYDEGYEPYMDSNESYSRNYLARASMVEPPSQPDEYFAQRNSIIAAAKAHVAHRQSQAQHQMQPVAANIRESLSGMDSDEEERLLDEATQEFVGEEDTNHASEAKSNVPRQSDSSTSSGRTWGSSVASSLTTPGTSLSPVDEHGSQPTANLKQLPSIPPPPAPPPTAALPAPPNKDKPQPPPPVPTYSSREPNTPSLVVPQSPSVQDRRSSAGQRTKRLKIETTVGRQTEVRSFETALSIPKRPQPSPMGDTGFLNAPNGPSTSGSSPNEAALSTGTGSTPSSFRLMSAPFPTPFQCQFPEEAASNMPTPALTSAVSNDSSNFRPSPQSASPINPFQAKAIDHGLLKSHSALSLRQKGLLTPNIDAFDASPGTPRSLNFSNVQLSGQRGPSSTPTSTGMGSTPNPAVEDVHLFANEIHSPHGPTKASVQVPYAPQPLEPCPDSALLRPFWLLRRVYQTIAHPRGGYLSLKIFIPREVWKVKNVKLKYLDDKIANCDLLTAALLKLGAVDTFDADAVLEEMQAFEVVLDQAQASLSKKLGNDVGVQNVSSLFKDAPSASPTSGDVRPTTAGDTTSTGGISQNARTSSKSYLPSWKKLRSKNSSANLHAMNGKVELSSRDAQAFSSVPISNTLQSTPSRLAKLDNRLGAGDVKIDGPNAPYMSSLAKLCDAAQVLDQITRQVEDPGLKYSSPTHVGLELSARHAAEFFAFYICRFVLQDITMLTDKFIKRASEWVLS